MGPDGRRRASLALALSGLALASSAWAFGSSYWCQGSRKVPKPPCPPSVPAGGRCLHYGSGNGSGGGQYIWETGSDKLTDRRFHAGMWRSCEDVVAGTGETCRTFASLTPAGGHGLLWLAVGAETLHPGLLVLGASLLTAGVRATAPSAALKLDAGAAVVTVLAGIPAMTAHVAYGTVFQLAVSLGPEDWRPHAWAYGWSYRLAWGSFAFCMAAAVTVPNRYTRAALAPHP